ncbi:MAG: acyl-CoA desaturase [Rhodospirillales bacterium]|nr:acyl-CoA desaturase [Rhodospirillales bacterium]MSP81265.1 acyl-CoA desaturase [Rhodospirillales bacterium]
MSPSSPAETAPPHRDRAKKYQYVEAIPFALAHVICFAAIWTGVQGSDLALAAGLYALRMFAVTAGYHRYFSHRAYKTSRAFQFILAFVAQSSAQRGVLWWAANHRHHHRYSDMDNDVHSPVRSGFWHAHLGWFFTERHTPTDLAAVRDLAKYPELRWLDRNPYFPPVLAGFVVWLLAGWSGLVVGFFWSTVAVWHATFSINSLAHVLGRRRYVTGDQSRNNWWLALLTFGEGWHNNHHHYHSAARQGFRWYEIDVSFYALKALAAMGLVWDLRAPPAPVVRDALPLRPAIVEKAAALLAASFQAERIAADVRARLAEPHFGLDAAFAALHGELAERLDEWRYRFDGRVETMRRDLEELIGAVHIPPMPSVSDLHARAAGMFARTPAMNEIVGRARQMLIASVCEAVLGGATALAART